MTKGELGLELNRLGQGFDVEIRRGQFDAYFELFAPIALAVFRRAVTVVLCEPRFPSLKVLQAEVEKAAEAMRQERVARERRQAGELLERGRLYRQSGIADEESAYNQFRINLLRQSIGKAPGVFARQHADQLAAWVEVEANQLWAAGAQLARPCGHLVSHRTVLQCVLEEQVYWEGQVPVLDREPVKGGQHG